MSSLRYGVKYDKQCMISSVRCDNSWYHITQSCRTLIYDKITRTHAAHTIGLLLGNCLHWVVEWGVHKESRVIYIRSTFILQREIRILYKESDLTRKKYVFTKRVFFIRKSTFILQEVHITFILRRKNSYILRIYDRRNTWTLREKTYQSQLIRLKYRRFTR